jgi:DNA-binding transcriptional regulator YhcF (GntR family)
MTATRAAWNEGQPISRQIMDAMIGRILEGSRPEGGLLPSLCQLAIDFGLSPLTAAKAFGEFQRTNAIEKRCGIGSRSASVRKVVLHRERKRFLEENDPKYPLACAA